MAADNPFIERILAAAWRSFFIQLGMCRDFYLCPNHLQNPAAPSVQSVLRMAAV